MFFAKNKLIKKETLDINNILKFVKDSNFYLRVCGYPAEIEGNPQAYMDEPIDKSDYSIDKPEIEIFKKA